MRNEESLGGGPSVGGDPRLARSGDTSPGVAGGLLMLWSAEGSSEMRCDEGWHTVLWCLVRVASALGLFGSVLWFNWFCVCVCFLSISKMDLSFHSLCVVVGIPSSTQLAPRHTP